MKTSTRIFYVSVASLLIISMASCSSDSSSKQTVNKEDRLEWWLDARFGMMIHWGAYAQAGGYWKGVYEGGYSEWLKFRGIPNAEYDSLVREFNPIDFDADEWVKIAKDAGMKYMVFTAKHHDGLAMYNSDISDYDIIDMTEFKRDPVGELAEACQKAGMKFGVYYSVDRDWHHPDAACDEHYKQCNFWDYPENKSGRMESWHKSYFNNYAVKQITELVTKYPIDIVWFDGIGLKTPEEVALLDSIIHANRPNCLINSRISNFVGSYKGDYGSKGDNETPGGYQAGGWENPGTLGFSYGYSERDSFMSPQHAIHNLIEIVSKGGNYLLNVGPNEKGIIIPEAVSILKEMGSWLKKYGSSIYGADGLPLDPPENIRMTVKPGKLFVHILKWTNQEVRIPRIDKVENVYMLSDPQKRPLKYELSDGTLSIDLSSCLIDKANLNSYAEVIVVTEEENPPEILSLWNGKAPIGDNQFSAEDPVITVYQPLKPNGAVVVICPGGGYGGLVKGPEGYYIAEWLNQHGITGAVLEYRLPNGNSKIPLLDAQQAVRMLRLNAAELKIDPERIGIMGFSAGGHLASTAATHFDNGDKHAKDLIGQTSCRPDFSILIYPVITMGSKTHLGSRQRLLGLDPDDKTIESFSNEKQVTKKTPPSFLAHAQDDEVVVPDNSRMFYEALLSHKVSASYLKLPSGGHGLNGYSGPMWEAWKTGCLEWLIEQKITK